MELLETWDERLGEFAAHISAYKSEDEFVYRCLHRGKRETKTSKVALNKSQIIELFSKDPNFIPKDNQ
jgi:hypothetical protein